MNWQKVVIEQAQLEQGRLSIHPDLPPIQPLTGTASYNNDTFTLTDFTAAFRSSHIHEMSGTMPGSENLTSQGSQMTIHSEFVANDIVELIQHVDPIPEASPAEWQN